MIGQSNEKGAFVYNSDYSKKLLSKSKLNRTMNFNSAEQNAFDSTLTLVNQAKIRINAESLKQALTIHHDFPSLASISEVLEDFNVPNLATKLSSEQLFQIPLPAIAHLDTEAGDFATIISISENQVEYKHHKSTIVKESLNVFLNKWNGITLLIEPNETSGEADYKKNKKEFFIENLRIPFAISGLLACLIFFIYPVFSNIPLSENWQFYSLIISKFIGTILSMMLIWYGFESNNPFLNKICQLNKKTNCQNILSSEAANIGGIGSWSDVGLIYFLGGLLSLLFFQEKVISSIQIIGLLALPYTFWSVYHQAFVAKVWCPLCLCVLALIWIEFFISLPLSIQFFKIETLLALGFCFLLIAVLLAFFKKPLKDSFRVESLEIELEKLKFNPNFIQSFLSKQSTLPAIDSKMQIIEFGNIEVENSFQIIINPVCGACRQKFLDIIEIVENNSEVKYQFILSSSSKPNELSSQITKTVLGLADELLMIKALHKWFLNENQDFEVWKNSLKVEIDNYKGEFQRLMHKQWLKEANINFVPAIFLNNIEIPALYKAKEAIKLWKYYQNQDFEISNKSIY